MFACNMPIISERLLNPSPIFISVINVVLLIHSRLVRLHNRRLLSGSLLPDPGVSRRMVHGQASVFQAFITRLLAVGTGLGSSLSYSALHYWKVINTTAGGKKTRRIVGGV